MELLRASLLGPEEARPVASLGHGPADAALKGGLRLGALHEVFPAEAGQEACASGFALALAMRAAGGKWLFWIRQDFAALEAGEISAPGLLEFGLDPGRVLLFRAAHVEDALRAAAEGLACASLGALILEAHGESRLFDLSLSRRLALAAARRDVTVVLLRAGAVPMPSAAETRWLLRAAASAQHEENWGTPMFEAQLMRNRHGMTGHWVMEWNADDGAFREGRAAHPRRVAAASAGRPAEAETGKYRRTG
jgi:protein ImuA